MSLFFTTTSTCFSANWLTLFCVMCNTVSTKIRESMAKNIQVFQSLRHSSLKEWSGEWRARVRLQFKKWLQSRRSWPLREVQSWIREKRDLNPKNKSSFAAEQDERKSGSGTSVSYFQWGTFSAQEWNREIIFQKTPFELQIWNYHYSWKFSIR